MGSPLYKGAGIGDKLDYLVDYVQELGDQLGRIERRLEADAELDLGMPALAPAEIDNPAICQWTRLDDEEMVSGCGHRTEVHVAELHPLFCPHCNKLVRPRHD